MPKTITLLTDLTFDSPPTVRNFIQFIEHSLDAISASWRTILIGRILSKKYEAIYAFNGASLDSFSKTSVYRYTLEYLPATKNYTIGVEMQCVDEEYICRLRKDKNFRSRFTVLPFEQFEEASAKSLTGRLSHLELEEKSYE